MAATKTKKRRAPKAETRHYGDIEQLMSEGLLSLGDEALGAKRHYNTLYAWTQTGITTQFTKGERVRLEFMHDGGVIKTTKQAYLRFLRKLNGIKP